jgi:hypothetical protein
MSSITEVAMQFFKACEAGGGWEGCKSYCKPDATFSAQAEPLAATQTLQQYADWMKGLMTILPDGRYELKSFASDAERKNVCAYGVFKGTHRGQGGPPPRGQRSGEGGDAPLSLLDFRPKSHGHVQRAFREDQYLKT